MDSEEKIEGALMSPALRDIVLKMRTSDATVVDINAALISLPEKQLLRSVLAGTATIESIGATHASVPGIKALLLAGLSVVVALAGVAATGSVGSIGEYDALTGVTGTGRVGTVAVDAADGTTEIAVAGVSGAGAVGTVAAVAS